MARRRAGRRGQLTFGARVTERPETGRGGFRKKAGRKKGNRVSHGQRARFSRHHPLHVTLRVREEAAGLRRRDAFTVMRRCIAQSGRAGFRVCEFNVLANHVHLVCEADGARDLTIGVQSLATRMALRFNRRLGRRGKVFADRYHARVMRTPRQVRATLVYVIQNLRHHAEGRRDRLAWDPFSSAASFAGWAAPLPRGAPWMQAALATARATAPPATWLLSTGWRLLGLVGLEEAPALARRHAGSRP